MDAAVGMAAKRLSSDPNPRASLNPVTIKSTIVAALGGLLFGFDTAVIAGTTNDLTAAYHLTPAFLGWTVSSAFWRTIIGAMFASMPGDRYALISGLFPLLAGTSGGVPFVFFSVMMVTQFLVVFFVYPETKGVSLEEMQRKLGIV